MITQTFESIRPKPAIALPWQEPAKPQNGAVPVRPNAQDLMRARAYGIDVDEYLRRDHIVRNMWITNPFKTGDIVQCCNKNDKETYGRIEIKGIFKSYYDFPVKEAREWPHDDKPYTLTVRPEKGNEGLILCTPEWLEVK